MFIHSQVERINTYDESSRRSKSRLPFSLYFVGILLVLDVLAMIIRWVRVEGDEVTMEQALGGDVLDA
ncbi:hypothetical protein LR48_Vigan05g112700 [Vigna angularis]|uniref:Uncharacterized protein n=1 Tax=Phaseolus angularis TaxID=3914 RepID=A0A0L9ULA5_PHAAN|nr:hypothetical protein LR48_Vigan05g112700 [Vigna angularis]